MHTLNQRGASGEGCIAIAAVGLAVALRMAVGSQLLPGLSFITFYPAIIIAALVGGFSRGLLATVLSALAAWYLFVPTYEGWGRNHRSQAPPATRSVCGSSRGSAHGLGT